MSDFLDHLLGQSQEPAANLAPRPLALHEPAPEPAAPPLDEAALAGGGLPEPATLVAGRSRLAPPAATPEPGRSPRDPSGDLRRRLDELQAWMGQLSARRDETPALIPPPSAPNRPASPPSQPPPVEDQPSASPPTAPITVVQEVSVHTPVTPALPSATPAPAARNGPDPVPLQVRPAPPEPQVGPIRAARSPQAQDPAPETKPAAQPLAVPPQEAAPARLTPRPPETPGLPTVNLLPSRQAAEPPPRPVVHVSIGRIEVRLARPGSPSARAAPPPSPSLVMSLEEYLRQRNGGGR